MENQKVGRIDGLGGIGAPTAVPQKGTEPKEFERIIKRFDVLLNSSEELLDGMSDRVSRISNLDEFSKEETVGQPLNTVVDVLNERLDRMEFLRSKIATLGNTLYKLV